MVAVNGRTVERGLWAGLLFGPIPAAVFAIGVAVIAYAVLVFVYLIAAIVTVSVWVRDAYFRWRAR